MQCLDKNGTVDRSVSCTSLGYTILRDRCGAPSARVTYGKLGATKGARWSLPIAVFQLLFLSFQQFDAHGVGYQPK